MANYAVIDDNVVCNIIVADSKNIVEEMTGKSCIEYTDEYPLGIGWYWDDMANGYVMPAPHPSWIYNYELNVWETPIPMPEEEGKGFTWDEATVSWVSFDLPVVK